MAPHSSILAWKIPWTEEPGRLQSMGLQRVGHNRTTSLKKFYRSRLLIAFSSVAQLCLTLCDPMNCNTPGFPVHHQFPEFTQTHVHPVISSSVVHFSSCPQSLPASVFSNESTLRLRWPKYWSFSFSISPCNEHPGLISFKMDWLDLFAVQGTLKSLLQHHTSKAPILRRSAFFTV